MSACAQPLGADEASSWYAVQTKPRRECLARVNLEQRGVESYLPFIREKVILRGRRAVKLMPLFPGYLFVRMILADSLDRVRWCIGVNRLVGTPDGPLPLPEGTVEAIQRRAGERGYLVSRLRAGQRVRIRSGPFEGLLAVVESAADEKERVRVLLDLFQRETRLDLDEAFLVRA